MAQSWYDFNESFKPAPMVEVPMTELEMVFFSGAVVFDFIKRELFASEIEMLTAVAEISGQPLSLSNIPDYENVMKGRSFGWKSAE
ncbi:MAG: hypothetical protein IPK04_10710 [Bdellovibrionales bacterium]|nr:hypothetical protein [Bdellovibrionales bacterium]